jgi:hypothetical protein
MRPFATDAKLQCCRNACTNTYVLFIHVHMLYFPKSLDEPTPAFLVPVSRSLLSRNEELNRLLGCRECGKYVESLSDPVFS